MRADLKLEKKKEENTEGKGHIWSHTVPFQIRNGHSSCCMCLWHTHGHTRLSEMRESWKDKSIEESMSCACVRRRLRSPGTSTNAKYYCIEYTTVPGLWASDAHCKLSRHLKLALVEQWSLKESQLSLLPCKVSIRIQGAFLSSLAATGQLMPTVHWLHMLS